MCHGLVHQSDHLLVVAHVTLKILTRVALFQTADFAGYRYQTVDNGLANAQLNAVQQRLQLRRQNLF